MHCGVTVFEGYFTARVPLLNGATVACVTRALLYNCKVITTITEKVDGITYLNCRIRF